MKDVSISRASLVRISQRLIINQCQHQKREELLLLLYLAVLRHHLRAVGGFNETQIRRV